MAKTASRRHREHLEMSDGELYAILSFSTDEKRRSFARHALRARGLSEFPTRERRPSRREVRGTEWARPQGRKWTSHSCGHCGKHGPGDTVQLEEIQTRNRVHMLLCEGCLTGPERTIWRRYRRIEERT
jgi:Pyruvate/2-oxoacid:ferredoxin oxidoreductase delta subunit